jgi:hypothetical protein
MPANRLPVPALIRGTVVLAAGLAFVLGGALQPAAATSSAPPPVALGIHRFGHLRAPDSIVAHADPSGVGFFQPPEGQDGVAYGPWSFDVARDGSVWLMDEIKHRLLVWQAGRSGHPARSVRLPQDPLERVAASRSRPITASTPPTCPRPGLAPRRCGWPSSPRTERCSGRRPPPSRSSTPSCASAPRTPCMSSVATMAPATGRR